MWSPPLWPHWCPARCASGVGFTAITNGWVHAPTSSSLSDVKSNTSGSGSAKAKSGTAVDWTAVAKEVSDSVVAIDVATSDGEAKGSGVDRATRAISPPITT